MRGTRAVRCYRIRGNVLRTAAGARPYRAGQGVEIEGAYQWQSRYLAWISLSPTSDAPFPTPQPNFSGNSRETYRLDIDCTVQ